MAKWFFTNLNPNLTAKTSLLWFFIDLRLLPEPEYKHSKSDRWDKTYVTKDQKFRLGDSLGLKLLLGLGGGIRPKFNIFMEAYFPVSLIQSLWDETESTRNNVRIQQTALKSVSVGSCFSTGERRIWWNQALWSGSVCFSFLSPFSVAQFLFHFFFSTSYQLSLL